MRVDRTSSDRVRTGAPTWGPEAALAPREDKKTEAQRGGPCPESGRGAPAAQSTAGSESRVGLSAALPSVHRCQAPAA